MKPEAFKAARLALGMTQKEIAAELGWSLRQIVDWEGGRARIPRAVERLLCGDLLVSKSPELTEAFSDVAGLAARESEQ